MKILILGSQGFIGNHLAHYYMDNGWDVTGCDLVEGGMGGYVYHKVSVLSSDFDSLFAGQHFDACINASGSGNVAYSITHPLSDFQANAFAVNKVLDTIRKFQPACKYLHISSAAVYGNPLQLPITEQDALAPVSPYGFHKWISEISCTQYSQLYRLLVAVIRPFSVFGNGVKKQLLWDICNKLTKADNITLFGTGNESRDFIHVSDLVRLSGIVMDKSPFACNVYNAASGLETTIREVANLFEAHFPGNKKIQFSGEVKPGDPINWRADVSRITALGFCQSVALEKHISEYIQWFVQLPQE